MNTENFIIVKKAFILMLPSLTEFVGNSLKSNDNKNWWKRYVIDNLHESIIRNLPKEGTYEECINNLDIQACLNIIEKNWYDIFQHKLNKNLRTWAHELKDIRNDVEAHYTINKIKTFNIEDVERALDTMARFMNSINKDVADDISYIKKNMKNEKKIRQKSTNSSDVYDVEQEYKKIERRIDGWFKRKEQYNSKILYAFLKVYDDNDGIVTYKKLKEIADIGDNFKGNFDSMKNFGERNHGKIFEQNGENVILWNNVKELILNKYKQYKK